MSYNTMLMINNKKKKIVSDSAARPSLTGSHQLDQQGQVHGPKHCDTVIKYQPPYHMGLKVVSAWKHSGYVIARARQCHSIKLLDYVITHTHGSRGIHIHGSRGTHTHGSRGTQEDDRLWALSRTLLNLFLPRRLTGASPWTYTSS